MQISVSLETVLHFFILLALKSRNIESRRVRLQMFVFMIPKKSFQRFAIKHLTFGRHWLAKLGFTKLFGNYKLYLLCHHHLLYTKQSIYFFIRESNKNKEKWKNDDASLYFVTVTIKNQPTKKVSKFVKKQQIKTFTWKCVSFFPGNIC